MNPQQEQEVLEQLAQIRRENRSLRGWIIFTGIGVGILIFVPELAAFVGSCSTPLFRLIDSSNLLSPLLAILLVIFVSAIVVSQRGSNKS